MPKSIETSKDQKSIETSEGLQDKVWTRLKQAQKCNSKAFVIPILTVSGLLMNSYDSSQNRDHKCSRVSFLTIFEPALASSMFCLVIPHLFLCFFDLYLFLYFFASRDLIDE